jgi:hypothetical protein
MTFFSAFICILKHTKDGENIHKLIILCSQFSITIHLLQQQHQQQQQQ